MCYRNIIIGGGGGGCCPQFRMPCSPCSPCCFSWFKGCICTCCRCISCLLFLVIMAIGIYTLYYYYLVLKLPPPIDLPNILKPSAKTNSTSMIPDINDVTTMETTMKKTTETTMETTVIEYWTEWPGQRPKTFPPRNRTLMTIGKYPKTVTHWMVPGPEPTTSKDFTYYSFP